MQSLNITDTGHHGGEQDKRFSCAGVGRWCKTSDLSCKPLLAKKRVVELIDLAASYPSLCRIVKDVCSCYSVFLDILESKYHPEQEFDC